MKSNCKEMPELVNPHALCKQNKVILIQTIQIVKCVHCRVSKITIYSQRTPFLLKQTNLEDNLAMGYKNKPTSIFIFCEE